MARVPKLKPEELSERQRALAASIGATRGGAPALGGPWGLLLRNEELCHRAAQFGTLLRDGTSLPKRLSEIAIAVAARYWSAQFEWHAHAPQAIRAGVSAQALEAIRERRAPEFGRPDEQAAYAFVNELFQTRRVSEKAYMALVDSIGADAAIELTAVAGFYAAVAMLIVAFEVDLPQGVAPPLPA